MGVLQEVYGITMLGKVKEGLCPMCACKHEPDEPHNRGSLTYQYRFYDEKGRWPKWKDAMAHCSEETKKFWIEYLMEKGVPESELM